MGGVVSLARLASHHATPQRHTGQLLSPHSIIIHITSWCTGQDRMDLWSCSLGELCFVRDYTHLAEVRMVTLMIGKAISTQSGG